MEFEFKGRFNEAELIKFVEGLNTYPFKGKPANYVFEYALLKKKIRITHKYTINLHPGAKEPYYNESVWGFIDPEGNIYKADTWNREAKHVRGSVFDARPYERHTWMSVRYLT